jgi:hypothetical protein
MRTTVTLDDDVSKALSRLLKEEDTSAKQVINDALRDFMMRRAAPSPPRAPFETSTVDLGRCLLGSLDDVADALALAEGDAFK